MSTTSLPLEGTYKGDPVHSSFGFAVRLMSVQTFRGTFSEVDVTLHDGTLEGRAKVDSISIRRVPGGLISGICFSVSGVPSAMMRP